jgi:hypothetical protein
VGSKALLNNTTGYNNTGIGSNTLTTNITGVRLTALGHSADVTVDGLNNATVIGSQATVSTSNTMVFGNTNVNQWAFGIPTTTAGTHALEVGSGAGNGNGAFLTNAGVWTNISDINKKEDFTNLNGNDLLQRIKELTIQRWKYKGSNEYHIGPYAQQFKQLFNVGTDDKSISSIDPAGISLAAVKELIAITEKQQALIKDLQIRIEMLEKGNR